MLMMGGSFLLLLLDGSIWMFLVVMVIFVVGEMLWVPTSQAIVAELAPEDLRGAYMGAFGLDGRVSGSRSGRSSACSCSTSPSRTPATDRRGTSSPRYPLPPRSPERRQCAARRPAGGRRVATA